MDTNAIAAALQAEISRLQQALSILTGVKRRGRPRKDATPPAWVTGNGAAAPVEAPAKKHRRKFSAAQRKQQAERMRAYWLAKKKAEAKPQSKAASKSKKTTKAA
jgi:hypothetical protein